MWILYKFDGSTAYFLAQKFKTTDNYHCCEIFCQTSKSRHK